MGLRTTTTYVRAVTALVGMVLVAGILPGRAAYADTKTTVANPEYAAALDELDRITDAYGSLAAEQDETLSNLEQVRGKISDNEAQRADVQKKIEASKETLAKKQRELSDFVSADYKSGGVSLLSIVLSSSSFEDLFSRIHYHGIICDAEVAQIDEVNAARSELEAEQEKLVKLEGELNQQEEDLEVLYQEQSARTEAMYDQQLAAAELVASLPPELQVTLEEQGEGLIADAKPIDDEAAAVQTDSQAEDAQQQETSDTNQPTTDTKKETSETTTSTTKSDTSTTTKPTTETPATTTPTSEPKKTGATGTQQAVLDAAYSTSGAEALNNGWGCAGWVYTVFRNSGVYKKKPTCAAWYYNNWCYSSDKADLQPGMVIAVSTWTGTAAGKRYGHVGIYIGNNTVRHLSAGAVRETSLKSWIKTYGTTVTPRWGWNGGIALS